MPHKIGIVTSRSEIIQSYFPTIAEPELISIESSITPDDQLVVNDLRDHGMTVESVIWSEPVENLTDFDLLVVRSPWDYMESIHTEQSFIDWVYAAESEGIKVQNPGTLMEWLIDMHYLEDLHNQGIETIPTTYLSTNSHLDLTKQFETHGEFILKPRISTAGIGLYHIDNYEKAKNYQVRIDEYIKTTPYMLQAYIPEIRTFGEWSMIFIGGEYSHSIHKKPADDSIFVYAERGGKLNFNEPAPDPILSFAKSAYKKILPAHKQATGRQCHPDDILYMRLDIIGTSFGPVLIECEGVEPELYFRANPASITKFREAVTRSLAS